jgi:hypothetical protein
MCAKRWKPTYGPAMTSVLSAVETSLKDLNVEQAGKDVRIKLQLDNSGLNALSGQVIKQLMQNGGAIGK